MFRDLMTIQDRMNRMFQEVFPTLSGPRRLGSGQEQNQEQNFLGDWTPAVDIYEDEQAITLKADMPGIDPDKLEIRVEGNRLLIRGERNFEKETKRENFYRVERAYGALARSFILPQNVQADKIDANYTNGVLTIRLPKSEDSKPKQIRVNLQGQEGHQIKTEGQQNRQGQEGRQFRTEGQEGREDRR